MKLVRERVNLPKKHHPAKLQIEKTGKASKRQDMVFNDEEARPNNEGPIGQASEAGIEGLGGDMHGYPTGMGAGAEPLGVFENEDTPSIGGLNDVPQSLDDKSEGATGSVLPPPQESQVAGPPPSSEAELASESNGGNSEESNEEDANAIVQTEPMKMKESPKAAGISMSNSVNDLDGSVNVQGDGEIGKFVRNSQQAAEEQQEAAHANSAPLHSEEQEVDQDQGVESIDPPFTGQVDGNTAEELKDSAGFMEREYDQFPSVQNEVADKRRLIKHKSKTHGKNHHKTWKKPFKVLQQKKN